MKNILKVFYILLLGLLFLPNISEAHAPNQSYIFLKVYQDSIGGYFEATTKDLNKVFNFGLKAGDPIEKVQPHVPAIKKYILEHLFVSSSLGNHPINIQSFDLFPYKGVGDYVQFYFELENVTEIPESLNFKYDAILEVDPTHRGLLVILYNWKAGIMEEEGLPMLNFSPDDPEGEYDLSDRSIWKGVWMMIESGVHHIWIGLDHILFILALILPSVVRRRRREKAVPDSNLPLMNFANAPGTWNPVEQFKTAFIYVLKIITFFTIAHSITLSLAALEIINLSSRFVEAVIALSIALAAFHNIRPIFKSDWVIAFAFGLFHGFGFASVLGEVGLVGEYMVWSLFGFNVGVELGQVAIIAIAFPILYLIRKSKFYPPFLVYGSVFLILIALYWFVERAFDVDIPLGKFVMDLLG